MGRLASNKISSHSRREVKRIMPLVKKVEDLQPTFAALTDEQLKATTHEFKERLAGGELLDNLLQEAFAKVSEAGK